MGRYSMCSVVYIALIGVAAAGTGPGASSINRSFRSNSGTYGVASIAGVTSRNGRVSSISSVKLYPGDSTVYSKSSNIPEPISFSKEENGRITSGSIKYGPGSVSVSSSARSYPSGSSKFSKPLDDILFPPIPMFNSRSFDPWFNFKPPTPPKLNTKSWPFSSSFSNPFDFWQ